MIKARHVGRGNQKRKSWRAQKGNLKEEDERLRSEMEGWSERNRGMEKKLRKGCRGKQEASVYKDVNNFSTDGEYKFWKEKEELEITHEDSTREMKRYKCRDTCLLLAQMFL